MFESKTSLCYCLEPRHLAQCALNFFKNIFFVEKQNNAYNYFNSLHFKIALSKLAIIYLSAHLKKKKELIINFYKTSMNIFVNLSLSLSHFVLYEYRYGSSRPFRCGKGRSEGRNLEYKRGVEGHRAMHTGFLGVFGDRQ